MTVIADWLILGGGVGGLSLAVSLAQQGRSFLVFEQQADSQAGAGLLLAPNATRVLAKLGVLEDAIKRGHITTDWSILDHRGTLLRKLQISTDGPPALSIHRAELIAILQSKLPVNSLHNGFPATNIVTKQEHIMLSVADGCTVVANALIGADGIRSLVRRHLFGDKPLIYRGYVGWRGIAPFVPRGYAHGVLSESWGPGGRFGIAPVDSSRTYWYASANYPEAWVDHSGERKSTLLAHFARWHEPVSDLIAATVSDQILVSRIYDAPPLRTWSRGNVTLLGDAAHAMTPNLGQGACLAIEDAWALGSEIASNKTPAAAFQEYQKQRIARARSVQLQSRAMGWIVQAESTLALAARNWITPRIPESIIKAGTRTIFDKGPVRK